MTSRYSRGLDEYISYYHPGWKWKLARKAASKAYEVASSYAATKAVLKRGTELNSLPPEMPPATRGSRALARASGKRKFKRAMTKLKAVVRFAKGTSKNPRSLSTLGKTKQKTYVSTHETGYKGAFKKERKVRRANASLFDKFGVVTRNEYNGVREAAECAYIGHGTPLDELFASTIRAIFRSLLQKSGNDIGGHHDNLNMPNTFVKIVYTRGNESIHQTIQSDVFSTTSTFFEVGNDLIAKIRTAITDADVKNMVRFLNIQLVYYVGELTLQLAIVNLVDYYICQDYLSYLKIKNVSLAQDASDGDLTTNVASQPLVGKSYTTTKWANGFELFRRAENQSAATVFNSMVAHPTTGHIAFAEASFDIGGQDFNTFSKPPPGYLLGTKKYVTQRINPGELKVSVCKWKATMKFDVFVSKYLAVINEAQSTDGIYRPIGSAKVFAFEREVEIGSRTNPPIRIAYGVNTFVKVRGYSVSCRMPPLTNCTQ